MKTTMEARKRVEMRKIVSLSVALLIGILGVLAPGPAWATTPLQYHGGPFLQTFKIYPLYYGNWGTSEITTQQTYVVNLAAYMSGTGAPSGEQPMMKQYGVNQVTVAAAVTASPTAPAVVLTRSAVLNIIHANQKIGKLPAFGANTLIAVFPAHGFSVTGCNGCGGFHASQSTSAFWAVVPADQEQVVIAHEIFESSADPAVNNFLGWDEAVDQCDNAKPIKLSFGPIPPAIDNTNGGACSTTGYTSLNEIQVYGWTYANYRSEYNTLWKEGWRLYSLQSYVLSNGNVLYNAVWRPTGNTAEEQLYGVTYADFRSTYNTLYPEGWRLYILQSYVLPNGDVLYNAVFRPGNLGEQQLYGVTYTDFRSTYNTLYPEGWRLYILQSYVLPNGDVLYNAVFRPGDSGETQVYGWTLSDFQTEYNKLWTEGWRLYILDSYIISDGTVRYNAVWRPATHGEIQVYDWTYSSFRTEYNTLWNEGWRLYILNAYVLPGDEVRYDAVWQQGTVDRPL
jgi:Bacterial tandem repeat domain 1